MPNASLGTSVNGSSIASRSFTGAGGCHFRSIPGVQILPASRAGYSAEAITTANSGTQAWGTNIAGDYTPGSLARLRSPVIDISGASPRVALEFKHFNDTTDIEGTLISFLDENENFEAVSRLTKMATVEQWRAQRQARRNFVKPTEEELRASTAAPSEPPPHTHIGETL